MAHKEIGRDIDPYLTTTDYLDANHPLVRSTADTLTRGTTGDVERVGRIYHYVRDLPYDILASFRYLAEGSAPPATLSSTGSHSAWARRARSSHYPGQRVSLPALPSRRWLPPTRNSSPDKEFLSPQVRGLWGGKTGRPLPWHSVGEAYLNGRWAVPACQRPPTRILTRGSD